MTCKTHTILAVLFILLLAFIAFAPRELKQIALAGTWLVMAIGAVWSVVRALLR